ncbi:hypothetical protein BD779DRAFT_961701 [Infundibulicybe gibba]|nr:hypothetical protein BD779DRAFT_961701 [Infundibulicybe gibba]
MEFDGIIMKALLSSGRILWHEQAVLLSFSWILIGCLARLPITTSIGRRYIHSPIPHVTERDDTSVELNSVLMDTAVLIDTAGQTALSTNQTNVATTISIKLAIAFSIVGIVATITIIVLLVFVCQQRTKLNDVNYSNRLENRGPQLQQPPPLEIFMRKSVHLVESIEDDMPNESDRAVHQSPDCRLADQRGSTRERRYHAFH